MAAGECAHVGIEGTFTARAMGFRLGPAMAVARLIAHVIAIHALFPFVGRDDDLLGGMSAVIATVFVFRETRHDSPSAGTARLITTCVSPALCLPYLLLFPFTPVRMAILPGIGTVLIMLLGRCGDIITTAIATVVVMVVAALSPDDAWLQPLRRLIDTVVGIAVGVGCKWIASSLFYGFIGEQPR
jgi:uncharacterized membrane protein YgaE (UPF0421/DUF939 family)